MLRRATLPRYLFNEVWPLYLAGLALICTLLYVDALTTAAGFILRNQTGLGLVLGYLASYFPQVLERALAVSIPFAVLLALGRLAKDSELKVTFSSGIRPVSVLSSLFVLGALVSAVGLLNNAYLKPQVNTLFLDTQYQVFRQTQRPRYETLYIRTDAKSGGIFYAGMVQQLDPQTAQLSGVMVKQGGKTYTALSGTWRDEGVGGRWTLDTPWEYTRADQTPVQLRSISFPFSERFVSEVAASQDLTLPALFAALERGVWDGLKQRQAWFDFFKRLADGFTPLFFVFAAGALGLTLRSRAGAFIGVILMVFAFYVVWTAMPRLVDFDALTPWVAAWVPNVLLGLFGLSMLRRLL